MNYWQIKSHHNLLIQKLILSLILIFNLNIEFDTLLFNNNILFNKFIIQTDVILIIINLLYLIIIKSNIWKNRLFSMEVFILLEIAILGLLLLLKSCNILIFFLCFELQTFCLYGLALLKKNSLTSNESGLKYFVTGALISSIFILGCSFCYGFYGTINFLELKIITEDKNFFFNFYSIFFIAMIFYKLGLFPLGQWMPDVYEASQNFITFFFSLVPKILYILLLIILFNFWLKINFYSLSWIMMVICFFSIIIGSAFSLNQIRVKRLLTYSGIVQTSYVVLGISLQNINSLTSSLFFLCVYTGSVYLTWSILLNLNIKQQTIYITDFVGLNKSNIILSTGFIFLLFNFAGLPPFLGFFSKLMILDQVILKNHYLLATLIVLTSALSIFYYLKVSYVLYFRGVNNYLYNFIYRNLFTNSGMLNFFISSVCLFILLLGVVNSHFILIYLFKLILILIN